MELQKFKLAVGSLLHDTGKILYRYNDSRNHSDSGYDFLKEIISDKDILDCVKYHHSAKLKNSGVSDDALCYITYIADNIAAFSDRRKNETGESGFVKNISYESIFNILNKNNGNSAYQPAMLTEKEGINFPVTDDITYSESFYAKVVDTLKNAIRGIEQTHEYVNSLVEISEACLSYVPSSTQTGELRDISLFDHVKLTSALALCIYEYAKYKNITNFKDTFFKNSDLFYKEKSFLLYSADISGIQNFIYNISRKSALKGLRARSFYLEIIMEHYVDTILERLGLARCNVMYTGGGHTYLLLPATPKTLETITETENEINSWFIDNFGSELFIAGGFSECSADSLRNVPEGSYREIFSQISKSLSMRKMRRYNAEEIKRLNSRKRSDNERECAICNSSDKLIKWHDNGCICHICNGLLGLSDSIIDNENSSYFTVISEKPDNKSFVPLPFNNFLISDNADSLVSRMKSEKGYVRSYSKNSMNSGKRIASKLWIGDYSAQKDFSELISNSEGIERLCVLRADIDNLGNAFVNGFPEKYTTISRTSEFSSKLSLFFKHNINSIMKNPVFSVTGTEKSQRNASIIYSGGDDVFVVGSWEDVIGFAVDLNDSLEKFSQGTLTISAGVGMFSKTYPLYAMAEETGKLEEISKGYPNKERPLKNAITLFDENNCYNWKEFKEKVVGEKLACIRKYLHNNNEHGKALLYNILSLIRKDEKSQNSDKLNIARFAYLLGRLAPTDKNDKNYDTKYEAHKIFAGNIYKWANSEEDCRQLITAIYLYIYSVRKKDNNNE